MISVSFENFLKSKTSNRVLNLCTNSELFQRQKLDLISRKLASTTALLEKTQIKYICTGTVKTDLSNDSSVSLDQDNQDSIYNFQKREKYFQHAAEQRQMISSELNKFNVDNLTLFSIVFDLLGTNHQNDLNKLKLAEFLRIESMCKVHQDDQDSSDDEDRSCFKACEQSSFILYNCARLNTIIEKFQSLVKKGVYKEISSIEEFNFYSLLKSDYEKKLCEEYLFKFEAILVDMNKVICLDQSQNVLSIKINTARLLKFLSEFCNQFSKYYSKVQILEVIFIQCTVYTCCI